MLALQGDFAAHVAALPGAVEVRTAREVDALDVLVIPGGESTTLLKLLAGSGIEQSARRLIARGGAIFGTCAGAIILARQVTEPRAALLGIDRYRRRTQRIRAADRFIRSTARTAAVPGYVYSRAANRPGRDRG